MTDTIKVSTVFPVNAKRLYEAWLDSKEHTDFTGSKATINPSIGGAYTAWDKYISGKTLVLQPYSRIVQSWRTTEFHDSYPDSTVEVFFEKSDNGTKLTIVHSNIPNGDGKKYEDGWKEFYIKPMKEYFKNPE
jgi:activator of HSP90 ATPase